MTTTTSTPKPITSETKRGETVQTDGGAIGQYVGTTPAGSQWVSYKPETFDRMAANFDKLRAELVAVIAEEPASPYAAAIAAGDALDAQAEAKAAQVVRVRKLTAAAVGFLGQAIVLAEDNEAEEVEGVVLGASYIEASRAGLVYLAENLETDLRDVQDDDAFAADSQCDGTPAQIDARIEFGRAQRVKCLTRLIRSLRNA